MAGIFGKMKDFVYKTNLLVSRSKEHYNKNDELFRNVQELLWRNVFVDTVKGYKWYHDKSISLGRWAIGYNYAYVLARVLDEFKPSGILECGLGQSSKIIADYVSANSSTVYDIVEQDKNWADFFKNNYCLDGQIKIHIKQIIETDFCTGGGYSGKTYIYEDFASIVEGKKYALISIDGPWGSEMYSRVDVLKHIPEILQDDFVIMVDDFGRIGEQNMVKLLKERLDKNKITYFEGKYVGMSDVCVIVSEKWKFLTTM